ncbi:hypothetical protein AQ505_20790 [Pedobacter sp. PACM 27299]|uniref:MarR family winged helix-turn-helix transcriptional regulator n=1 Tax=Pedobacter sp. PACM 27299 TaxID=1727164 RepID=UPI00070679AB|nr:winged helix DNA-binding protein [Pedobacter sp. PACM 27299]ALL07714.1 hypothetical protein AQ505_20790 [Pedobacter sp. PACM 27299]
MIDYHKQAVLFKQLYVLKKLTDDWGDKNICHLHQPHFNMAFLPFFMAVGLSGKSSSAIAADLKVSRQATGKIMKELEQSGLIKAEKSTIDARANLLQLTEEGRKFYLQVAQQASLLSSKYEKLIGKKQLEMMTETMEKMIHFHEKLNQCHLLGGTCG